MTRCEKRCDLVLDLDDDRRPITEKCSIIKRNHVVVEEDDAEKGIEL